MPYFSIIIPLYNKENFISDTLKSVFSQSFSDFEIIIVNDGSTDKSEEKVLSFNDSRIQYFHTENRGVSLARNYGISKANGKIIAFLDADDIWFSKHLEHIKELSILFPECGLFATNYELYYNAKRMVRPKFTDIHDKEWKGILSDFFKSSYINRIAWTSAVAVPKRVFETVGNFNPNITLGAGEDTDLWIRIALNFNVAFNNQISARHVLHAENRISLTKTLSRSFAKFDTFKEEEKKNISLKRFLDLYRAEFAIKHKIAGDLKTFEFYRNDIDDQNISRKTLLLLNLPAFILKKLFTFKKFLERKNILISIYH